MKENFCGACLLMPLALAGGTGGLAYASAGEYRDAKNMAIIITCVVVIIFIVIYLKFYSCRQCMG